jgi:hypothetical protein
LLFQSLKLSPLERYENGILPVFAFDYTVFIKVLDVVFLIVNPYLTHIVKYGVRSPKFIWAPAQSTYIYRVQSSVWRLPNF